MTTSAFRPMSLRCRLGLHAWQDIACPDGQSLRTCTRCGDQQDPIAQYERQRPPRENPGCYPM